MAFYFDNFAFLVVISTIFVETPAYVFHKHIHGTAFVFAQSQLSLTELRQRGNRLYLNPEQDLTIYTQLVEEHWSEFHSRELTKKYALSGLQPSITFRNKTWWQTYIFPALQPGKQQWRIVIPKHEFIPAPDDVIFEPWFIKLELGINLGLFETKGVLIPDLLVNISHSLGEVVASSAVLQNVGDPVITSAPCMADIMFMIPFKNKTALSVGGCYLGITFGAFTPDSYYWVDICSLNSNLSICHLFADHSCHDIRLLDVIVTRQYIILVTSYGLLRSPNLKELVAKNRLEAGNKGFQQISSSISNISYENAVLQYSAYCLDFHIFSEKQDIFYIIDDHKHVFRSYYPFTRLTPLSLYNLPQDNMQILAVINDRAKNTDVFLCSLLTDDQKRRYMIGVLSQGSDGHIMFPPWLFSDRDHAKHMSFHTWSDTIFVYGSQVWQSFDGGNTFQQLTELTRRNHIITSLSFPQYGDTVVALSNQQILFHGRIGVLRLIPILHEPITGSLDHVIVDELDNLIGFFNNDTRTRDVLFSTYFLNVIHILFYQRLYCNNNILLQLINTDVAILYVSGEEDELKSYCFGNYALGHVLRSRGHGGVHITQITHLNTTTGFLAKVQCKLIELFESALPHDMESDIDVRLKDGYYEIWMVGGGWSDHDEGKTLVLSDGMSILLREYHNSSLIYALPPPDIPASLLPRGIQEKDTWQMYDLRSGKVVLNNQNSSLFFWKDSGIYHAQGSFNFSADHVEKVLMISNSMYGVITELETVNRVRFSENSMLKDGVYTGWSLYEPPFHADEAPKNTGYGMWWLEEERCSDFPIITPRRYKYLYHLDSRDSITFEFSVLSTHLKNDEPQIEVLVSNPALFNIESHHSNTEIMHSVEVDLQRKPGTSGLAQMYFSVRYASLRCPSSSNIITIHGGCPPSKKLVFHYPLNFTREVFLDGTLYDEKDIVRNHRLPPNYRPPSSRGIGIPMSSNLYNVHPEKPPYKETFAISRETKLYKQCEGKLSRKACGCDTADFLNMSTLVIHSDCINTVYVVFYNEIFRPRFSVIEEDADTKPFEDPYYIVELNQRLDYHILWAYKMNVDGERKTVLQANRNSSVEFMGSGLFHFRAYAVKESYTLCNLVQEFIVYVDEMPLPRIAQDIVRLTTAMAFVAVSFSAYLWYFYFSKQGEVSQVFGDD